MLGQVQFPADRLGRPAAAQVTQDLQLPGCQLRRRHPAIELEDLRREVELPAKHTGQGFREHLRGQALGNVAHRATVDALADRADVLGPRDDDHRHFGRPLLETSQGAQTIFGTQAQVQQTHLQIRMRLAQRKRLLERRGLEDFGIGSHCAQQ